MEKQPIIPSEIIYQIAYCLSPRGVVRLRTVSKRLRDISYDPMLWRTLYATARVPRPPGPFPFHSVRLLERTLLKSERLSRSWTTQPMRYGSSVNFRLGMLPTAPSKIVDGKWLIGCESSNKLTAHDLDSETMPHYKQVLWEHDTPVHRWDTCSLTSAVGPVLYILLSDTTDDDMLSPWKLLEFRVNSDSGHLHHTLTLDIPMRRTGQPGYLRGGHGPFLYIEVQNLIYDTETRRFYEFPLFAPALQAADSPQLLGLIALTRNITLLTKTHILILRDVLHNGMRPSRATLVQAFTLPTDACSARDRVGVLRLSHEGIIRGFLEVVSLIRNSVVDLVCGATNIRLLSQSMCGEHMQLFCMDLTLPKHAHADGSVTLPMTTEIHEIFTADNVYSLDRGGDWTFNIEFWDEGCVRGLWLCHPVDPAVDGYAMRFTIDASQERCTGVLGQLSPLEWCGHHYSDFTSYSVDGARGKLCYGQRDGESLVVVDFE